MHVAVIILNFDATFQIAGLVIRWQTLATAAVIVATASLAAAIAGRMPPVTIISRIWRRSSSPRPRRMSREDLLYILCGAVPGALIGGRVGYVITHLDYYGAHPLEIINVTHGSFELTLAVLGGTVTAGMVAKLFGEPVGRWMHAAAVPLLLAIAGGKLAMALGGAGQGTASTAAWATAYLGQGPWGSLAPELPAQPSQLYESVLAALAAALLAVLLTRGWFRSADGRAYYAGITLWCIGRVAAGFTWRDPAVLGPLGAEQLLTIAVGFAALATALAGAPDMEEVQLAPAEASRPGGAGTNATSAPADGATSPPRFSGPA